MLIASPRTTTLTISRLRRTLMNYFEPMYRNSATSLLNQSGGSALSKDCGKMEYVICICGSIRCNYIYIYFLIIKFTLLCKNNQRDIQNAQIYGNPHYKKLHWPICFRSSPTAWLPTCKLRPAWTIGSLWQTYQAQRWVNNIAKHKTLNNKMKDIFNHLPLSASKKNGHVWVLNRQLLSTSLSGTTLLWNSWCPAISIPCSAEPGFFWSLPNVCCLGLQRA